MNGIKKSNQLYFSAGVAYLICIIITMLSPRFGYQLNSQSKDYLETNFRYTGAEYAENGWTVTYKNGRDLPLIVKYESLFSNGFSLFYAGAGDESRTINIAADGTFEEEYEDNLRTVVKDMIYADASRFYNWLYLTPLFFIVAAAFGYRFYVKSEKKRKAVIIPIISCGCCLAALFFAARGDTLVQMLRDMKMYKYFV